MGPRRVWWGQHYQLKNVQHIQASFAAFATILADGFVVTWGRADHGGDSSAALDQLRKVQQIQANQCINVCMYVCMYVCTYVKIHITVL